MHDACIHRVAQAYVLNCITGVSAYNASDDKSVELGQMLAGSYILFQHQQQEHCQPIRRVRANDEVLPVCIVQVRSLSTPEA